MPVVKEAPQNVALPERDEIWWICYQPLLIVLAYLAATAAGLENRKDDLLGDRTRAWPCPTSTEPAGAVVHPGARGGARRSDAQPKAHRFGIGTAPAGPAGRATRRARGHARHR